jgi:hypothetical protein
MIVCRQLLIWPALSLALSGCNTNANAPLVFLQAHTLGITANASSQATPELTLGFRDLDVAVVPTQDSNGNPIRSVQKGQYKDALSVFGQFDTNTALGTSPGIGLGKFFATGTAAAHLAQGFQHKLCGANC